MVTEWVAPVRIDHCAGLPKYWQNSEVAQWSKILELIKLNYPYCCKQKLHYCIKGIICPVSLEMAIATSQILNPKSKPRR
jgi:hypothetical protein